MRKFYLILLSLCAVCCLGQNQINGYTYWYNNDYASRITQVIAPQQQVHLSFLAETSGTDEGLNVFHFQAFDINGVFSSPVSKFFYKTKGALSNTNRIAAYRYWFNADLANADTVYITPAKQADILTEIDANALNDGLNSIHIQTMDQQEIWSSVLSQYFLKSNTHYINAYQYWFNDDIASAVTVDVFPSKFVVINDDIDASALNEGINILHLRFRDEQNLWGSTISQFFFKTETGGSDTAKICAYQYWFDNDFAGAVTENINPVTQAQISAAIPTGVLYNGFHVLNIRFKQENGLWSSPLSSYFFKMPESQAAQNLITEYQYWFNSNFAQSVHHVLPQAMAQHELLLSIDMTQMPKGNYVFNLRTKDTLGMWSSVITNAFTKNPLPISSFTANITEFCDSGLVQFTNNSIDGDVYLWDFGDGSFSNLSEPQHFFTAPGQYNVSLTVTDIATQLDSTISQLISVHPWYHFADTFNICVGEVLTWRGQSYNQTGVYYDSLTTVYGCDSIFILHLIVQNHYEFVNDDTICSGDTYFWKGSFYSQQGFYYDSLITQYGCDSVFVLHLIVSPVFEFTQNEAICQGESYNWRGNNFTLQGTYYDSLATVYGCDSIFVLHLTVNPVYEFIQSQTICLGDTFTWRGYNYALQGSYYDSLTTYYGCDSVYTLNLSVNPVYLFTTYDTVCQGDILVWRGNNYSIAGSYYDSLFTQYSCDSVFVLNLAVRQLPAVTISGLLSAYCLINQNYLMQGSPVGGSFTGAGVSINNFNPFDAGSGTWPIVYCYADVHSCINCDTVYVTVNPTYEFTQNAEICLGDTLLWRGQHYYAQGSYYDTVLTQYGCDSVYVLNLQVNPMYFFMDAISMCDGETVFWHGNTHANAGVYYDSLQTINGCDSVFSLNLSIFPNYYYAESDTFCEGSTYFWRGNYYTSAGTYYNSYSSQHSCDSIYSLELIMRNRPNVNISSIDSLYCIYNAPVTLTATPPGGVFIGQGVSGSSFSPTTAGLGNWFIAYSYTDSSGCFNADTVYVTVDACTHISDNGTFDIKLYPNPNDGNFEIDLKDNSKLSLYNSLGELVYTNILPSGKHFLRINDLTNGLYLLKAETASKSELIKIIIMQ